ncbi:hypothetical protein Riv7116_1801 [Rivularia sp. PCC 7116]|jgi:hypothetical protein|nr:hypothetical protein Riv7116_1801 [Rivularia sp. PCC 7116]
MVILTLNAFRSEEILIQTRYSFGDNIKNNPMEYQYFFLHKNAEQKQCLNAYLVDEKSNGIYVGSGRIHISN